jgi:hypothetical protein
MNPAAPGTNGAPPKAGGRARFPYVDASPPRLPRLARTAGHPVSTYWPPFHLHKLLRADIAAIVRSRAAHQETINEINTTRRNAAIAVKACRGRQARVASDAPPVSRGRAGPRRPAPASHVYSRHWLPSEVSKSPSRHAAARYRRRSHRGRYHTDRQPGDAEPV